MQVTTVTDTAGGSLGTFQNAVVAATPDIAGYAAFQSGSMAYALGGVQTGAPSANALDGDFSLNEPRYANFNDAAADIQTARYLYGFTRVGAFNYLVGGLSTGGAPTATSEYNVR
jgi:hypothetical protein